MILIKYDSILYFTSTFFVLLSHLRNVVSLQIIWDGVFTNSTIFWTDQMCFNFHLELHKIDMQQEYCKFGGN